MVMVLIWCLLALFANCSAADNAPRRYEIPLLTAIEYSEGLPDWAPLAIDGDTITNIYAGSGPDNWLKVYFKRQAVGEVVIFNGNYNTPFSENTTCDYQVSVVSRFAKGPNKKKKEEVPKEHVLKPCGDPFPFPSEDLGNHTVDCEGEKGGAVIIETVDCNDTLTLSEVKVYEQDGLCLNAICSLPEKCNAKTGECEDVTCTKSCKGAKSECYWKGETMKCRCPGMTYGKKCKKEFTCADANDATDKGYKKCQRQFKKNEAKFTKKCKWGKKWGKKQCPILCGYCDASEIPQSEIPQ